jgi:translation initiation factor 4A
MSINSNKNDYKIEDDNKKYEFNSWDELEIKTSLLRGIYSYGFENPSPIQKKGILPFISKNDLIAQAQSGTGKTGCFTIGTLEIINEENNNIQAIILSPTRELALQIQNVIDKIGVYMKNLKTQLLVGGTSTYNDIDLLKNKTPHILIACPGRLHDLLKNNHIDAKTINLIVIDEADEMLSYGFKDQIYNIFKYLSNDIQVALFSATMPRELYSLTDQFLRNPTKILVKNEMLTLDGIIQYYINLEDDNQKFESLKDLFSVFSVSQCIIYCNSVKRVSELYNYMVSDGFPVCQIHSNMTKEERKLNYNNFREGKERVLISSNVTARGIDIQQVSTVINFDIPKSVHTYLHRIGRSGRWGRKGTAINFITRRDYQLMKDIENYYNTNISELPQNYKES